MRRTEACGPSPPTKAISGWVFGGADRTIGGEAVVMVASHEPNDALYHALHEHRSEWADRGVREVNIIGDADAPSPIAWAAYADHRYADKAEESSLPDEPGFEREPASMIR